MNQPSSLILRTAQRVGVTSLLSFSCGPLSVFFVIGCIVYELIYFECWMSMKQRERYISAFVKSILNIFKVLLPHSLRWTQQGQWRGWEGGEGGGRDLCGSRRGSSSRWELVLEKVERSWWGGGEGKSRIGSSGSFQQATDKKKTRRDFLTFVHWPLSTPSEPGDLAISLFSGLTNWWSI